MTHKTYTMKVLTVTVSYNTGSAYHVLPLHQLLLCWLRDGVLHKSNLI